MKKKISSLFLVIAMLMSWSCAFAVDFSYGDCGMGTFKDNAVLSEDFISEVDGVLESNGTSINQELFKLRQQYNENALAAHSSAEKEQWLQLVSSVDVMLSDYSHYVCSSRDGSVALNGVGDEFNDAYLKAAVAAVVSFFIVRNYSLSAELLSVARTNTSTSFVYTPAHKSIIEGSSVVQNLIKNNKSSGSGEFPSSGNKDLYYAIHYFNYSKSQYYLVLTDYYDYEHGDEVIATSLTQYAVDTMYRAQAAGIIVPYNVYVKIPK